MDLQKFIIKNPYLYHLTSAQNADNIIATRKLISTNELISLSGDDALEVVKREKRKQHLELSVGGVRISIRDQQPISPVALPKCLTDGWKMGDFLYHLNDRVFMWPTQKRLWSHFKRYAEEKPVIFRFSTEAILTVNPHVKFSRLNSGATRANSHLGGKAPERGPNTFQSATDYNLGISSVAEVTFERQCVLTGPIAIGSVPDGPFKVIQD